MRIIQQNVGWVIQKSQYPFFNTSKTFFVVRKIVGESDVAAHIPEEALLIFDLKICWNFWNKKKIFWKKIFMQIFLRCTTARRALRSAPARAIQCVPPPQRPVASARAADRRAQLWLGRSQSPQFSFFKDKFFWKIFLKICTRAYTWCYSYLVLKIKMWNFGSKIGILGNYSSGAVKFELIFWAKI